MMRASVLPVSDRPPVPRSMPCPSEREMNLQDEMGNLNKNPRSNVHPDRAMHPPLASGFQDGSQDPFSDRSGRGYGPLKPPASTHVEIPPLGASEGKGSTPCAKTSDSGQDAHQHEYMLGAGTEPEAKRHDPELHRPCGLSEPPLASRLRSEVVQVDDSRPELLQADMRHRRSSLRKVAPGGAERGEGPQGLSSGKAAGRAPALSPLARPDPLGVEGPDVVYDGPSARSAAEASERLEVDSGGAGQDKGPQRQSHGAAAGSLTANSDDDGAGGEGGNDNEHDGVPTAALRPSPSSPTLPPSLALGVNFIWKCAHKGPQGDRLANECSDDEFFPTSHVKDQSPRLGMVEEVGSSGSSCNTLKSEEVSTPITMDRKSYSPRVVEGHQRGSPASPTVTASSTASDRGGGGGAATSADTSSMVDTGSCCFRTA